MSIPTYTHEQREQRRQLLTKLESLTSRVVVLESTGHSADAAQSQAISEVRAWCKEHSIGRDVVESAVARFMIRRMGFDISAH